MENISEHITYKEATRSRTASIYGIRNRPNVGQLGNMKRWAENIFEKVRCHFDHPIFITSFFRSPTLNRHPRIKGSRTSSHVKGQAGDTDDVLGGPTNSQVFHYIKDNLDFDQLIWEFGDKDEPAWVHSSYVSQFQNRHEVLRAIRFTNRAGKKKTKYIPYI